MVMAQLDPRAEEQLVLETVRGVAEHVRRLAHFLGWPELPTSTDAQLRASVLGRTVHDVLFWANHPETIPPEADATIERLTEALFSTGMTAGYTIPETWWETPLGARCRLVQDAAIREEML